MNNYSGILFKIISESGFLLLIGVGIILLSKPWIHGVFHGKTKIGWTSIAAGLLVGMIYFSRILFPQVSVHTGVFLYEQRTNISASVLPVTHKYVFDHGSFPSKVFFLDVFSLEKIYPDGFSEGKTYSVFYDEFTKVIVRIEDDMPEKLKCAVQQHGARG